MVLEVLATVISHEEEIKDIRIGKEVVKLSLFTNDKLSLLAGDMIVYIENPKDSTKKLLELINEFNEAAGYKINIQKTAAFSHGQV